LAVGAVVRVAYLVDIRDNPDYAAPGVDADFHDYWARGLATGDWTTRPGVLDPHIPTTPYIRPPGYPYFLALIYYVLGDGPTGPRLVQFTLGLVNAWLAFVIGRRWFSTAAALMWSAMMSVYWAFVYFEGEFHDPAVSIFLLLAASFLLGRWHEEGAVKHAAWAGVLLGLAALFRPNVAVLLAAAPLWMALTRRRAGRSRKSMDPARRAAHGTADRDDSPPATGPRGWVGLSKTALHGAALAGCGAACVSLATWRNILVADDFVVISANGGVNLYIGNHEEATGYASGEIPLVGRFHTPYDYRPAVEKLERALGRPMTYSEASDYFAGQAWSFIRAHPGRFLELTLKKAAMYWGPHEIANNKELHYERAFSPVLSRLPGGFTSVLALALAGAVGRVACRARSGTTLAAEPPGGLKPAARCGSENALGETGRGNANSVQTGGRANSEPSGGGAVLSWFACVIAVQFLTVLPFFAAGRYRVAIIPFLMAFASVGLAEVWDWLRQRRGLRVGVWVATCAIAWMALSVPYAGTRPDLARWYHDRGGTCERLGRLDEALANYRQALTIDPRNVNTRLAVAEISAARGDVEEAERQLLQLLAWDHQYVGDAQYRLGQLLVQRGDAEAALPHFREAIRLEADNVNVRLALANALRGLGRVPEAIVELEAVLAIAPERVDAHAALGLLLRGQGREAKARWHLARALQLAPDIRPRLAALGVDVTAVEGAVPPNLPAEGDPPAGAPSVESLLHRADQLASVGRLAEAIELLERADRARPGDALIQYQWAEALAAANRWEDARDQYTAALAVDPNLAAAHVGLGIASGRLDEVEQAVHHYRQALLIDPTLLAAWYNLATALGDGLGRYDEATEAFEKARALAEKTGRADLVSRIDDRLEACRAKAAGGATQP